MEDELFSFYESFITAIRTPTRAEPLITIVATLIDFGYADNLWKINNITKDNDNLSDSVDSVEGLIMDCAENLLSNMGVSLDKTEMNKRPSLVLQLLELLTGDIENFDDPDTMFALSNEDASAAIQLENILRFIHFDSSIFMDNLIYNVEDRVMTVIRNYLDARIIENSFNDVDYVSQARLVLYIRQYPTNPMVTLFANASYKLEPKYVAEQLQWNNDSSDVKTAVCYLVGLAVLKQDKLEDAKAKLEEYIHLMPIEDNDHDYIIKEASEGLKKIYEVVLGVEEDE